LMIAEFNPGKRHRDVLQAFAGCPEDAVLAFAGIGPLEQAMSDLAKQLGISDRVRFLGYRRDIPVLLRASSALLLPSEREGLPRSIMEALCLGTPVISTRIRGVEDLLADDCGIMTEVGDVAAIGKAINWVLEHPVEARAMGLKGQAHMQTFSIGEVIQLHEALYETALGRPLYDLGIPSP
jgi:glycosyltransferase involved in cell wall biosynthesis